MMKSWIKKIGITLIATGFEQKDPVQALHEARVEKPTEKNNKIVMTLGIEGEEKKMYNQQHLPFVDKDPYAPTLKEPETEVPTQPQTTSSVYFQQPPAVHETPFVHEPAEHTMAEEKPAEQKPAKPKDETSYSVHLRIEPVDAVAKKEEKIVLPLQQEKQEEPKPQPAAEKTTFKLQQPEEKKEETPQFKYEEKPAPPKPATGSFLNKPSNIYADESFYTFLQALQARREKGTARRRKRNKA